MKYVIVLGDGMADEPIEAAGGKTPLQLADKPVMDEMAKVSEQGIAYTVPSNLPAGSDVANLSMLGYDPQVYYSGRSPLEALSIGVDMKDIRIYEDSNSGIRNAYDAGCKQIVVICDKEKEEEYMARPGVIETMQDFSFAKEL